MPQSINQKLVDAISLAGFENWRPHGDFQQLNRPPTRPSELPGSGRVAAVMVLFYPGSTDGRTSKNDSISSDLANLKLVLTKRNASLSTHASQISFPGGRQELEETLQQTALRETSEEIGITASKIEVLGQLNSIDIPPSDFTVTPFVGWHPQQPHFIRRAEEVDEIIETSVEHLLNPSTLVFGDIEIADGKTLKLPFYEIGPHQVWGATAIILGELIERFSRVS